VRISILSLFAVALISGCATVSHTPLSKDVSDQLQGKTVTRTKYSTPDFTAFTAGKAAFALLGAAAMIAEGNSIVKENEIADPSIEISEALAGKLATTKSMKAVDSARVAESDTIESLVSTYPGADYLLDVKTFNWMFNYYPTDWAHYKVTYSARLRLIDTAKKTVVAETMCQTVQGDDAKPPTKDQLLDAKAALLKSYLKKGASACVEVLAKNILQL
jgi:hypothetical protein